MNAQLQSLEPVAGTVEEPTALVSVNPARLLEMAVNRGADLPTLERFMDLQDRWEAKQAKNAFTRAFADFKANPPQVFKDKLNKQYDSTYTSLGNLVNTTNEALAQHGLTTRWDIKQDGPAIEVTCYLTHVLGHFESVTMRSGPDKSGAKNDLQQIKSTTTYLKGSTFEAVTGIASSERTGVNKDDDGNGAGECDVTSWLDAIAGAVDKDELLRIRDEAKTKTSEGLIPKAAATRINAAWSARAAEIAKAAKS